MFRGFHPQSHPSEPPPFLSDRKYLPLIYQQKITDITSPRLTHSRIKSFEMKDPKTLTGTREPDLEKEEETCQYRKIANIRWY
jgi:hypothetical protein